MDKKARKERADQLINDLAKSTSPEVEWMRELFDLQFEDAKDRLVSARGDEFLAIQGEAKYLENFHRKLMAASAMLRLPQRESMK